MASANLTGNNIQDTYQRLLQISSSGEIADGTGSLAAITSISASETGSFGRIICTSITASTGDFDANTIRIGGTPFSKADLDNLRQGKTINTLNKDLGNGDAGKTNIIRPEAIMHPGDDTTYSKYTTTARIGTFVNGTLFHDLNLNGSNNYIALGAPTTELRLTGNITASSNISASGDIYFNNISGGTF